MATKIKGEMVKKLRHERGWTQDDLAKKAGLNKQSVLRIEKGEYQGTRRETIAQLCKAFDVDPGVLTGRPATIPAAQANDTDPMAPEAGEADPFGNASQLNLRVDNAARNALALTARRYGVQLSEIVEIAPFLFFLMAERSLQRRRETLCEVGNAIAEVEALRDRYRYLPIDIPGNDDQIYCEENSIEKNDIFGRLYEAANNGRSFRFVPDYDDNAHNPFAAFLKDELKALKDALPEGSRRPIRSNFAGWHPDVWSSPGYQICLDEVIAMVGSDSEAVQAVLSGKAPLHEIPKHLKNSPPEELGEWVKAKAKENEIQLVDLL
jgi:transcriptional regulator with XRE-family HTH domain